MVTVLGVLLALSVAFFVGFPLWKKRPEDEGEDLSEKQRTLFALDKRKEETYRALKDLDLDYQMGKLSLEDYQELNQRYKEEALALLKEMDEEQGDRIAIEAEVEREILAARRRRPADRRPHTVSKINFCSQCGAKAREGDRFCAQCGQNL